MNYEEIYEYLKVHSPEGVEFGFPDDRDYWNVEYKGNTGWTYIPKYATVEELDKVVKGCVEYFDIKTEQPVTSGGI